jgi:hypothetical protein
MVAGRLAGTLDGRPFTFEADGDRGVLTTPSLRSALRLWRLRQVLLPLIRPLASNFSFRLTLKIRRWPAFRIV